MDFLLTPSGDITFEMYEKQVNPFVISFITSKTKTLSLSFHTDNLDTIQPKDTSLVINFSTYNPSNNKTISVTSTDEFYEQQIKIRLLTALGDMKSCKTIGSTLDKHKHIIMDTEDIDTVISAAVKDAIQDIIPNCEITVILKEDSYYGYNDYVVVEIYDQDKNKQLLYEI